MSLVFDLPWPQPIPGLHALISRRGSGVSPDPYASLNLGLNTGDDPSRVVANRRALYASLGLDLGRAVFLQQVHGDRVIQVGAAEAGRGALALDDALPEADALFTLERGLTLNIGVADCLAVVLCDGAGRGVGIAHAGWRGALAGLPAKTALALAKALGQPTKSLYASLSTCLGPCHLELAAEQHAAFATAWPGAHTWAGPLRAEHFMLDLWGQVREQLLGVGLSPECIAAQRLCSWCEEGDFYSFRRDKGQTGRMLALATLS